MATLTEPRESDSAASGIYGVLRAPHFAVAAIYETAHGLRSGPQSRGQLIEDACLSNKKASAHRSQRRAIRQGISARHCAGPDREAQAGLAEAVLRISCRQIQTSAVIASTDNWT